MADVDGLISSTSVDEAQANDARLSQNTNAVVNLQLIVYSPQSLLSR